MYLWLAHGPAAEGVPVSLAYAVSACDAMVRQARRGAAATVGAAGAPPPIPPLPPPPSPLAAAAAPRAAAGGAAPGAAGAAAAAASLAAAGVVAPTSGQTPGSGARAPPQQRVSLEEIEAIMTGAAPVTLEPLTLACVQCHRSARYLQHVCTACGTL